MTKQLADLFSSFSDATDEEQHIKVRRIRTERSIERPAVAKRQQKKAVKKSRSALQKAEGMIDNLSEEAKAALIAKLKGELE